MGVIIFISIFIIVLFMIFVVGGSSEKAVEQHRTIYYQNNKIPNNTNTVFCIELNEDKLGKHCILWKEDNYIKLCKLFNVNEAPDIIVEKTIIPIKNIKIFTRDGEYRVDNIVEGGGVNLAGAVVGGAIAGGAGAVLAGRQKITTTQKEIDKRQTYLYYMEDNQEKRIVFSSDSYNTLRYLLPDKEIGYIEKHKIVEANKPKESNDIQENSIYKDIEELARLKDKGILTEEEFVEKKKLLLDKIQ